jgi:coenzyme F420-reducing hydrogenase beta subunit
VISPKLRRALEGLWATPQENIDALRSAASFSAGMAIQTHNGEMAIDACRMFILLDAIIGGETGLGAAYKMAKDAGMTDEFFEEMLEKQLANCGVGLSDEEPPVVEP